LAVTWVLKSPQEFGDTNLKGIGNQLQRPKGHALLAGFEPVKMDTVQAGKLRELVLREAFVFPQLRDPLSNRNLNVLFQFIRLWAATAKSDLL
jgi:hypothetical protein